jgi:integrase
MTKRVNGEGTFMKRGNTWTYRVVVDGVRYVGSGRTQADAKKAAKERARIGAPKITGTTFATLFEEWSRQAPESLGIRPSTFDTYRYLVGKHVLPIAEDVRMTKLTASRLKDLFRDIEGSSSTKRNTYAGMVSVLKFGVSAGYVGANIMRDVPRPSAVDASRRDVNGDGARALIAAAKGHRWGLAAWLGFGCGLRRGEMLGLRWSDVDLVGGTLSITGNVTRTSTGLRRGPTKNKRGLRLTPMPVPVADALKSHRATQAAERLAAGELWQDCDMVLTNEIGGMVEPRALSRAWSGWARKAKVKDRGTHLGRHYAATTLLASGQASTADVAAQLGQDPAVLLNTYASAVAKGQRAASTALGAELLG